VPANAALSWGLSSLLLHPRAVALCVLTDDAPALCLQPRYRDFLITNARSAWVNGRDPATNRVGVRWAGPFTPRRLSEGVTQTAALDLFNALQGIKLYG
jgi:hypothetical protein